MGASCEASAIEWRRDAGQWPRGTLPLSSSCCGFGHREKVVQSLPMKRHLVTGCVREVRLRPSVILTIAMCLMLPTQSHGQNRVCASEDGTVRSDGSCWNNLEPIEKYGVIRGIWSGQKIESMGNRLMGKSTFSFSSINHYDLSSSTTIGDVAEYFDKLYSYPVNRDIEWMYAYLLASMYLNDSDSNDRVSLLRFLRDYGMIPTHGKLISFDSINTINVLINKSTFKIRLSGLSEKSTDDETQERSQNILSVLQTASYGKDCPKPDNAPSVSLEYHDELFDKDGNLSAYVTVFGYYICIGKERINIGDVFNYDNGIPLNTLLASRGLVIEDDYIDPKWDKSRRFAREFSIGVSFDEARKNKYYAFGQSKRPDVEFINSKVLGVGH